MLLVEIAAKLAADGLVPSGYIVAKGKLPPTPDKVIVVYETGGLAPQRFFGDSTTVEMPGLQFVVRGAANDYEGPRLVIDAVFQATLGWGAFTADGVRYVGVDPQQSPFPFLRSDDNNRTLHAFNAIAMKEVA